MHQATPRIVIVGAGFAGLWAARTLARQKVQVTLIDRNNYHVFLPILYQVSAAEIEPEEIAYPIRSILHRSRNVGFDLAEVKGINRAEKKVICEDHEVAYDYLILATGSTSSFFNIPGASENAFALKTMAEGIRLRNHILCCFEHASHEPDEQAVARRLTFVIAGGGPTGVEFVGALAELIYGPLRKDYPEIDFKKVRLILLEAKAGILDTLAQSLREYAARRMRKMGVEIMTSNAVTRITPTEVFLKDGTVIASETVIWTAGVKGAAFKQSAGLPLLANGRIAVQPTLQMQDAEEIYIAGDLAAASLGGQMLPMVAPTAIAEGTCAARNILRQIAGKTPLPLLYQDKGTLVTLGRNRGVASIGRLKLKGFPAWLLWVVVHLFKLIGFRNRLLVAIDWVWDYLFFERSVRLIISSDTSAKEC